MAQNEWILGQPVQTDTANYEWVLGLPYILAEEAGGGPTNVTVEPAALALSLTTQEPSPAYDFTCDVESLSVTASVPELSSAYDFQYEVPAALGVTAELHSPTPAYDIMVTLAALALSLTMRTPEIAIAWRTTKSITGPPPFPVYRGNFTQWVNEVKVYVDRELNAVHRELDRLYSVKEDV